MATDLLSLTMRRLRRLSGAAFAGSLGDADLVERVIESNDEAAFEVLVWRHGPMVLNVCRRILRHDQDAEDAFQVTFVVLFRKLQSLSKHESVGAWLHRVAFRVALRARSQAERRAAASCELDSLAGSTPPTDDGMRELIDQEINRLPGRLRRVAVLCLLEGKSYAQAANEIGCPLGTVQSRLARARHRLQARLARYGIGASASLAAVLAAQAAAGAVPSALIHATQAAACGSALSAAVASLTRETLHALWLARLGAVVGKAALTLVVLGLAGWLTVAMIESPPEPVPPGGDGPPARQGELRQAALKDDLARIAGEWQLVSGIEDSEPMPADKVKATVMTFLPGNRVSLGCHRPDDAFRLVAHTQPAQIHLEISLLAGEIVRSHGVYEIRGDTLRVCLGTPERPAREFASVKGTGHRLWVFHRPGADVGAAIK